MRKWIARAGWALVLVLLVSFVGLATWEPFLAEQGREPQGGRQYRAEIIRSEFGVPHIYGKTDADVAFGVAVAQAEDDFFTLQDVVAMARGRYGAIAGEDGAQIDYAYHLLDARGTAERHYPSLPADTRALFEAYAAGLNHYARKHPQELKLANLFPVSGIDIAAGFALRQPFFFGLNNAIAPLVSGGPLPREYGPDIPGFPRGEPESISAKAEQANLRSHPLPWGEMSALSGSNAFAVAPAKSGGATTLISNSHQPLRGGVAWYEMVVESEQGWHYAGANFPGSPYPFLGHNRHLGWTNTVNRPDMVDIYRLEMDASGTRYKLDGKWRALESRRVWLPVRFGPLVIPYPQTVHRSAHGPVIFNHTGVYALRYGGIDRIDQLDAYYRLNKATNLAEWQAQLARMAVPSTNFIYADEKGNIAYVYNAAIPNRPGLDKVKANWRGILPGDRSDLIWQGAVDYRAIPKLINPASGWLYNANNEPYTAAGAGDDLDPADFSPVLGVEDKQTNRSRRAWKLMSAAPLLDRAALRRIKYDTAYERTGYVGELWAALEQLDLAREPQLAKARDLLMTWDFTSDGRGRADSLALLLIKDFMSAEYQNKPLPDVKLQLRKQVDHLTTHFGRIDPPMRELLRLRQGDVDLPLDGGSDTLRASTTWKVDADGRLSLVHGDSFIQWVEWRPGERVRSQSIQPFGAAISRPGSLHYTDQMQLFVRHQLKPVHFWREDALANARRRYVVESH